MDGPPSAAQRILALAEEERQLVADGRHDELAALQDRRDEALAELPDDLSPEARDALGHALALQRQVRISLGEALAATGAELGQVAHGRAATQGYSPAGVDPRRTLDRIA